ncbi:hypothetical protein HDU80_011645 [Chytriomyces hyalinus]|nr:hypothetical protein HDU80_011645 [Chytriomyces hyalinus]
MDGYIAVFDKTGTQVWKSFTAASQGSSLCLQSNGGVVYYDGTSSHCYYYYCYNCHCYYYYCYNCHCFYYYYYYYGFYCDDDRFKHFFHNYNQSQKIKDAFQKQEIEISQPHQICITFFNHRN